MSREACGSITHIVCASAAVIHCVVHMRSEACYAIAHIVCTCISVIYR